MAHERGLVDARPVLDALIRACDDAGGEFAVETMVECMMPAASMISEFRPLVTECNRRLSGNSALSFKLRFKCERLLAAAAAGSSPS